MCNILLFFVIFSALNKILESFFENKCLFPITLNLIPFSLSSFVFFF